MSDWICNFTPFNEGCTHRGEPGDWVAHVSLGDLGEVQLKLIEHVRGESLYSEFLAENGPGLHHVAFLVPEAVESWIRERPRWSVVRPPLVHYLE